MKMYTWTVKISVADLWVADGFNLTDDRLEEMVRAYLHHAVPGEFECKVLKSPDPREIIEEQGG